MVWDIRGDCTIFSIEASSACWPVGVDRADCRAEVAPPAEDEPPPDEDEPPPVELDPPPELPPLLMPPPPDDDPPPPDPLADMPEPLPDEDDPPLCVP